MFYTYILYSSLTLQPFYVGKGSGDRSYIHERDALQEGYGYRSVHRKIQSILKKGGKIVVEQISQINEESAFALEIELIAKYGRKDIGTGILCNLTDGGEGCRRSPESVERTAAKHRGMKRSDESKERMRQAQYRIKQEMIELYGEKRSPESITKQSAKTKGQSWSDNARAVKRNKPTAKPVLVYKKNTNEFVGEWESIALCAKELALDHSTIWKICKGDWLSATPNGKMHPYKSHKGYIFRYKLP